MNILFVTPWRLDATGGVSVAVGMLYRELEGLGHRVVVLIADDCDSPQPIEDKPGFTVFGMHFRTPYIKAAPVRALLVFLLFLPITLLRLRRFIAANRIDVVHVHYPLPSMVYFGLLRRFSKWRLVVTYHGSDAHDLPGWTKLEQSAVRWLLTAADQITGVAASLLAKVVATVRGSRLPCVVVPNGAPVEAIASSASTVQAAVPARYIVTVGLVIRRKGVDVLLDALQLLAAKGETVPLVVVGDGVERSALEQRASQAGIGANVHFLGRQSHEHAVALMKQSTFFVLASRAEGLPLVVAEAMACGKTVVATAVDGVPGIVTHDYNGLLVPSENPAALAEAIGQLWRDDAQRARLAQQAYDTIMKNFSWKAIVPRYAAIYEQRG